MSITASEARKNLFPLIEKVNDDRVVVEITSRRGDAVLLSRADYEALEETAHLLRVPANAMRLIESLQQALAGDRQAKSIVEFAIREQSSVGGDATAMEFQLQPTVKIDPHSAVIRFTRWVFHEPTTMTNATS